MAIYSEDSGLTLLSGSLDEDGHPLSVARINGAVPPSFPHELDLGSFRILIDADGTVTYDDQSNTANHPAAGVTAGLGSFTYTLTDGFHESPPQTATIELDGIQTVQAPVGDGADAAGWDPFRDAGSDGDWFVEADGGSDSNAGTSVNAPFQTVQRAIDATVAAGSVPGTIIRVRDGVYREMLDCSGLNGTEANPIRISGYATEKPRITGSEILTGLVPCGAGRAGLLGPNYAQVYERTFSIAGTLGFTNNLLQVDLGDKTGLKAIWGLNPYEQLANGEWRPLSMAGLRQTMDDLLHQTHIDDFFVATDFKTTGGVSVSANGNPITAVEHAGFFSSLNQTALAQSFLRIKHSPTVVSNTSITAINGDQLVIERNPPASFGNPPHTQDRLYMIANYLDGMPVGSWGAIDNNDGTATVFVRPHETASVAAGRIEWSLRNKVVMLGTQGNQPSDTTNWLTLSDMHITQAGGVDHSYSFNIGRYLSGGSTIQEGIAWDNLYVGRFDGSNSSERGFLATLPRINKIRLTHVTLDRSDGGYGIGFNFNTNLRVQYLRAQDIGQTPMRGLSITDAIWAWNHYENCGRGGHSNQGDFKAGSQRCWLHGCRTRNCIGYFNFQNANSLFYTSNDICASTAFRFFNDGRSLQDQNGTPPVPGTTTYVWNNFFQPDPQSLTGATAVSLGKTYADMNFSVANNIIHGGGVVYAQRLAFEGFNLYTDLGWFQSGDLAPSASSVISSSLFITFVDPANGDFRPGPNSPWLQMTGRDMADLRSALYTAFDPAEVDALLDYDILGQARPTGTQPIGPYITPEDWH